MPQIFQIHRTLRQVPTQPTTPLRQILVKLHQLPQRRVKIRAQLSQSIAPAKQRQTTQIASHNLLLIIQVLVKPIVRNSLKHHKAIQIRL